MVATREIEELGEWQPPFEQEQSGPGGFDILLGISLDGPHPAGNEQLLGLERLQQGERHSGPFRQFRQREQLGRGSRRRRLWGRWLGEFPDQCLVGRVQVAVDQPDDGGEGEAAVLQGTNPGDAVQVSGAVPRHPPFPPRRVE